MHSRWERSHWVFPHRSRPLRRVLCDVASHPCACLQSALLKLPFAPSQQRKSWQSDCKSLRRCAHKSASGVNPWKSRAHQESVQISAPLLCVGNLQVFVCAQSWGCILCEQAENEFAVTGPRPSLCTSSDSRAPICPHTPPAVTWTTPEALGAVSAWPN